MVKIGLTMNTLFTVDRFSKSSGNSMLIKSHIPQDMKTGTVITLTRAVISGKMTQTAIGRFQAIKTDVLLIFSFITGDKTEFLSPMMFSNEHITGI